MPSGTREYDKNQAYDLLLASALAYVDYSRVEANADGYFNLSEAIANGTLDIETAIRNADITFNPNGDGVSSLADRIRERVATQTGDNAWQVKVLNTEEGEHQALVIKHNDQVIASFRGTQFLQAAQWGEDFDAVHKDFRVDYEKFCNNIGIQDPEEIRGGTVHKGFIEAVNGTEDQRGISVEVEGAVKEALGEQKGAQFFICGHSLGAAMAEGYAALTQQDVAGVFGYGNPKLGDKEFCDFLNGKLGQESEPKYWYFTNNLDQKPDIVSIVPPEWMDYSHAGQEVLLYPPDRPRQPMLEIGRLEEHLKDRLRGKLANTDIEVPDEPNLRDHLEFAKEWRKEVKAIIDGVREAQGRIGGELEEVGSPVINHQPYLYANGLALDRGQEPASGAGVTR